MKLTTAILFTSIPAVSTSASTAHAHDRHGNRHGERDHTERERITVVVRDDHRHHRRHRHGRAHHHKGRHHRHHWKRWHDHRAYRPRYRYYEYRPIIRLPRLPGEHWGVQLFYFD